MVINVGTKSNCDRLLINKALMMTMTRIRTGTTFIAIGGSRSKKVAQSFMARSMQAYVLYDFVYFPGNISPSFLFPTRELYIAQMLHIIFCSRLVFSTSRSIWDAFDLVITLNTGSRSRRNAAQTYSVSPKIPLSLFDIFPKGLGIFSPNFYTPIVRSYLRWTTNFYSIICNFDKVMPY